MTEATQEQAAPKAKKETQITTVTMKDGRVVDFPGKRKLLKENIEVNGVPGVRLDFINGESREVVITIGATEGNSNGLLATLAQHGLKQKLGDETAGVEDIDDQVMAVDDLIDRLAKGDFTQQRSADGLAGASILLKALIEVTGKDAEVVKGFLKDKTAAEKKALRNDPKVAPVVQRLEAEKAAKSKGPSVDTDALLSQLG